MLDLGSSEPVKQGGAFWTPLASQSISHFSLYAFVCACYRYHRSEPVSELNTSVPLQIVPRQVLLNCRPRNARFLSRSSTPRRAPEISSRTSCAGHIGAFREKPSLKRSLLRHQSRSPVTFCESFEANCKIQIRKSRRS